MFQKWCSRKSSSVCIMLEYLSLPYMKICSELYVKLGIGKILTVYRVERVGSKTHTISPHVPL